MRINQVQSERKEPGQKSKRGGFVNRNTVRQKKEGGEKEQDLAKARHSIPKLRMHVGFPVHPTLTEDGPV